MMVYSRIFQDQGAGGELGHIVREDGKSGGCRLLGGERPKEEAEGRNSGAGEGEEKGGDRPKKGKKKRSQKDIIRSRIGRRSCTLRDRTQNDVAVPPWTGTMHHRQSRCAYGRARMGAVELVVTERAETTTKRRRTNGFSIVLNRKMLAKLRPA